MFQRVTAAQELQDKFSPCFRTGIFLQNQEGGTHTFKNTKQEGKLELKQTEPWIQ